MSFKLSYEFYILKPNPSYALHLSCEGVVLKFEEEKGVFYSLYHPIESLGDLPLKDFIKNKDRLLKTKFSNIRDFAISYEDLKVLKKEEISTYFSCPNFDALDEAFENKTLPKVIKLKIKDKKQLSEALVRLKGVGCKVIFDANARLEKNDLQEVFLKNRGFFENQVLYFEDPTSDAKDQFDFKVASDFVFYEKSDVSILKPTGFNHPIKWRKRNVVTSYLDHPLGQKIAANWIVKNGLQKKEVHGIKTSHYFERHNLENVFDKNFKEELEKDL